MKLETIKYIIIVMCALACFLLSVMSSGSKCMHPVQIGSDTLSSVHKHAGLPLFIHFQMMAAMTASAPLCVCDYFSGFKLPSPFSSCKTKRHILSVV